MESAAIHRVIERNAATRGEAIAIVDGHRRVTYRELNQRANATARHLMANGFHRGSRALIRVERSVDLAVVLLAVLKAGGTYALIEPTADPAWQAAAALSGGDANRHYIVLDPATSVKEPDAPGPNLPVVTRGADVACVLPGDAGSPAVLVPHATIAALRAHPVPPLTDWPEDPGALGLWLALMAGATIVLRAQPETAAA